jgi:hypothetical protein
MSDISSNVSDAIAANSGVISLLSIALGLVALGVALYTLFLTLRIRRDLKRDAAARATNANEFLSTMGHLSRRLDRTD